MKSATNAAIGVSDSNRAYATQRIGELLHGCSRSQQMPKSTTSIADYCQINRQRTQHHRPFALRSEELGERRVGPEMALAAPQSHALAKVRQPRRQLRNDSYHHHRHIRLLIGYETEREREREFVLNVRAKRFRTIVTAITNRRVDERAFERRQSSNAKFARQQRHTQHVRL
jgi:hypothetical protein